MAAVNSLLFLLTALAPYPESPENSPVTYRPPAEWNRRSFSWNEQAGSHITCPENELYRECGTACPKNCANFDKDLPCPYKCVSGCFCEDTMIRGPDGKCIYKEECWGSINKYKENANMNRLEKNYCSFPWTLKGPFNCPPREHYRRCGPVCPQSCCPTPCPFNCCMEGCFCDKGYIRGPNGSCISKEECSVDCSEFMKKKIQDSDTLFPNKTCPPKEWYTCSSHCQRRCVKSWWPCPGWCVPGCECIWPLVRGPGGNCITRDLCPKDVTIPTEDEEPEGKCEPDQEMSCFSHCQKNCTNYDQDVTCPIYCVRDCVCKEPMIRGPDGSCILPQQCPSLESLVTESPEDCSDTEIYDTCGTPCEANCTNYNIPDKACLDKRCVAGCFCQPGYIRSHDGQCILPFECWIRAPELVAESNPSTMQDSNIFDIDDDLPGADDEVQNIQAEFVSEALLVPDHCLFDQIFNGSVCQSIDDWKNSAARSCLDRTMELRSFAILLPCGVNLFSGVYFVCCPKNDSEITCSYNEEYRNCGTACPKNCDNYDKDTSCISANCVPGCFCKDPLIRGPDGKCIYPFDCFEITSKEESEETRDDCTELEFYDDCGSQCETDCYNYNNPHKECEDTSCRKGCFCRPGWVRSPDRKCVLPNKCPASSNT